MCVEVPNNPNVSLISVSILEEGNQTTKFGTPDHLELQIQGWAKSGVGLKSLKPVPGMEKVSETTGICQKRKKCAAGLEEELDPSLSPPKINVGLPVWLGIGVHVLSLTGP